eukprot:scaffold5613_cov133-Isochrysis_galbana.AAC.2
MCAPAHLESASEPGRKVAGPPWPWPRSTSGSRRYRRRRAQPYVCAHDTRSCHVHWRCSTPLGRPAQMCCEAEERRAARFGRCYLYICSRARASLGPSLSYKGIRIF